MEEERWREQRERERDEKKWRKGGVKGKKKTSLRHSFLSPILSNSLPPLSNSLPLPVSSFHPYFYRVKMEGIFHSRELQSREKEGEGEKEGERLEVSHFVCLTFERDEKERK